MSIKNKVAIITGASSGIGLTTAKLFSKNGAKVILVSRSKNKLTKISSELPNSIAIQTDMTSVPQIKKMVKKVLKLYGRIDILVNCAGRGYDSLVEDIDLKSFRYIIDLDLIGPIVAMQEVIPIMRKQGGGSIINISSGTSKMYLPTMSGYSSIKTALNAISLIAREELESDHINVSVIYPYMTATDFEKNTIKSPKLKNEVGNNEDYSNLPPPDPPEKVALKILEAVTTSEPEIYVHDFIPRK